MKLPTYLDDLRGNSRTLIVVHNGATVRLVATDHDPFDADSDLSFVVADVSRALLAAALEVPDEPAPARTQTVPLAKRPGRRKPRWFRGF